MVLVGFAQGVPAAGSSLNAAVKRDQMEIAQKQYKQLKAGSGSSLEQTQMQQLRQGAKALSNMAATMPYRLPNDTNKRLIELELDMH